MGGGGFQLGLAIIRLVGGLSPQTPILPYPLVGKILVLFVNKQASH